jgi:hypothetical protein
VQSCPKQNVGILRAVPGESLREDHQGSGVGRLTRRPDVAVLVLILVFGAFVNAAGMTGPVMMWMHHWHARLRLSSMVPVVTAIYAVGLLILPVMLAAACGWMSRLGTQRAWKDLTCSFTLALVPVGFSMWLAHFSNHLFAGWSAVIPAVARFISPASSINLAQAWVPAWIPSLELCFLDAGLLLTLYTTWRVACRLVSGDRRALVAMFPWAVLAGALYSAGVWIVFQPMQMRGMMMH